VVQRQLGNAGNNRSRNNNRTGKRILRVLDVQTEMKQSKAVNKLLEMADKLQMESWEIRKKKDIKGKQWMVLTNIATNTEIARIRLV